MPGEEPLVQVTSHRSLFYKHTMNSKHSLKLTLGLLNKKLISNVSIRKRLGLFLYW